MERGRWSQKTTKLPRTNFTLESMARAPSGRHINGAVMHESIPKPADDPQGDEVSYAFVTRLECQLSSALLSSHTHAHTLARAPSRPIQLRPSEPVGLTISADSDDATRSSRRAAEGAAHWRESDGSDLRAWCETIITLAAATAATAAGLAGLLGRQGLKMSMATKRSIITYLLLFGEFERPINAAALGVPKWNSHPAGTKSTALIPSGTNASPREMAASEAFGRRRLSTDDDDTNCGDDAESVSTFDALSSEIGSDKEVCVTGSIDFEGSDSSTDKRIQIHAVSDLTITGKSGGEVLSNGYNDESSSDTYGGFFDISEGSTVTITGLTLFNGWANFGGCVGVRESATVVLVDVTFSSCTARYQKAYGGALYIFSSATGYGSVTVSGSAFNDNLAEGNGGDSGKGRGGAIFFGGNSLKITSTSFSGNSCYGGSGTEEVRNNTPRALLTLKSSLLFPHNLICVLPTHFHAGLRFVYGLRRR